MISIDKKTCAACQRCCHGTPGTHIHAHHTANHRKPVIDKNHRCEFLNSRNNCGILNKPIECAIFPIVISGGELFVDMACPAWNEAVKQWDEQFGDNIDNYNDGRYDHKFVNLWIAQSQLKEKKKSMKFLCLKCDYLSKSQCGNHYCTKSNTVFGYNYTPSWCPLDKM